MAEVDNEDLMMNLQRVAVLMRRSRRAKMKARPVDKQGEERVHEGKKGSHGGNGPSHGIAFSEDGTPHGYGNHKCHGGSGRHGQNRILAVLMMQDGTSQKDLAYILGIRPQSLTQALEALETDGLIRREQDDNDKRARRVYLTDDGRRRATKVAEDRKSYAENAFSMLTEEEKGQLASILDKISASLDAELPVREADE